MNNKKEHNFLWGVVNIGQQTEGGINHSDWAQWARRDLVPRIDTSNDYWHVYAQDHAIASDIGCNALRITIEWARIEPREGHIDVNAIAHYRAILQDLKNRNLFTCVGLWHWSIPDWCEKTYGVHGKYFVEKFMGFVQCVCDEIGDLIDQVVVLNEPSVFLTTSYICGTRPPFVRSRITSFFVMKNLLRIHKLTYILWKESHPTVAVGSTFLWNHEAGAHGTWAQSLYIKIKEYFTVTVWIRPLVRWSDYIGINYYTSNTFYFGKNDDGWGVHETNNWHDPAVWHHFPEGIFHVLVKARKFCKPIYILENGKPTVAGTDDVDRQEFLRQTIVHMHNAMKCGVDVRGYFHYSLCDSYEWDSGYGFKFGLVEIDRHTRVRTKRRSCNTYAHIIKKYVMK